jgi:LysM repeat protein
MAVSMGMNNSAFQNYQLQMAANQGQAMIYAAAQGGSTSAAGPAPCQVGPQDTNGAAQADGSQVKVKQGDTLSGLMKSAGYTDLFKKDSSGQSPIQRVAQANGLSDPNLIRPGQTLTIPAPSSSPASSGTQASNGNSGGGGAAINNSGFMNQIANMSQQNANQNQMAVNQALQQQSGGGPAANNSGFMNQIANMSLQNAYQNQMAVDQALQQQSGGGSAVNNSGFQNQLARMSQLNANQNQQMIDQAGQR